MIIKVIAANQQNILVVASSKSPYASNPTRSKNVEGSTKSKPLKEMILVMDLDIGF